LEKALGPEHPDVATAVNNLALLYQKLSRPSQAEPLFLRCIAIREKHFGPRHPSVVAGYQTYAAFLVTQRRMTEALPIMVRLKRMQKAQ